MDLPVAPCGDDEAACITMALEKVDQKYKD
jgi:hypothetical protein